MDRSTPVALDNLEKHELQRLSLRRLLAITARHGTGRNNTGGCSAADWSWARVADRAERAINGSIAAGSLPLPGASGVPCPAPRSRQQGRMPARVHGRRRKGDDRGGRQWIRSVWTQQVEGIPRFIADKPQSHDAIGPNRYGPVSVSVYHRVRQRRGGASCTCRLWRTWGRSRRGSWRGGDGRAPERLARKGQRARWSDGRGRGRGPDRERGRGWGSSGQDGDEVRRGGWGGNGRRREGGSPTPTAMCELEGKSD